MTAFAEGGILDCTDISSGQLPQIAEIGRKLVISSAAGNRLLPVIRKPAPIQRSIPYVSGSQFALKNRRQTGENPNHPL
jgi:hypothetical protein